MSKLNANAKPFSFNPSAAAFTPAFTPAQTISAASSSSPSSAPSAAAAPSDVPATTTTNPPANNNKDLDSWETLADGSSSAPQSNQATSSSSKDEQITRGEEDDDLTEEERRELREMDEAEELLAQQEAEEMSKATQTLAELSVKASPPPSASPVPSLSVSSSAAASSSSSAGTPSGNTSERYSSTKAHDEREHINIVFIGHVDAGKSTISGQILFLTGQVDERTIQKYEREAKEKNRESWYLAYVMDTNEEERAKGKTVEVGRAHFATPKKRYTLLDAPGHKNYVPNMIGGAQQADVGVLVISARKGEFETGFDRGGQTREHAMLAKTLGLAKLIVLVNKMDDPTVQWSKERYDEIVDKLSPFLQKWGYKIKSDVFFCPCSGYTGANLRDRVKPDVCNWYEGDPFFSILDNLSPLERDPNAPLRLPVITKYKDMGSIFVLGKLESGTLAKDTKLMMVPNNKEVQCTGVSIDEEEVDVAKPGENVIVKLKGIEEDEILSGFVLSYPDHPCKRAAKFDAQVVVMDLLEHKPIMTAGYSAVLHVHAVAVECIVQSLLSEMDKKTGEKSKRRPRFAKNGSIVDMRITVEQSVAVEIYKDFPQLGRFTLRDEGKTIAIGKITKLYEE